MTATDALALAAERRSTLIDVPRPPLAHAAAAANALGSSSGRQTKAVTIRAPSTASPVAPHGMNCLR